MNLFKKILNLRSTANSIGEATTPSSQIENLSYTKDGLLVQLKTEQVNIKWLDIKEITAYKLDLMTFDEIRMDLMYADRKLSFSEEFSGWEHLIAKTKVIFPSILKDWDLTIVQPPFKENLITLYKKGHHKIFADFNNTAAEGGIRLNTEGSLRDIANLELALTEGQCILLDDEDELSVFGIVRNSTEGDFWIAEINWDGFIYR